MRLPVQGGSEADCIYFSSQNKFYRIQSATVTSTRPGNRGWRPLLAGSQRKHAWRVVHEVAEALRDYPIRDASLATKSAELAILFSYLARTRSGNDDQETSVKYLDQAIEALSHAALSPALHGGFTEVAWACEVLSSGVSTTTVDSELKKCLKQTPWKEQYDLISGLVGIGVYALERMPRRSAEESLKHVIRRLEELSEQTSEGITWHTHPNLLPEWQRQECPNGYYNLGLAHGIPGVIGILGAAYAAGVERKSAKRLLEGAVQWIFQHKLPRGYSSTFTYWAGPDIKPEAARSAWCYGDPGVAAALFLAATSVRNTAWKKQVLKIACRAAKRPAKEARVKDAGLCHGAAGLGHIFNRMSQATGNRTLRKAARFWFQRTLELRRSGQGIAGFSAYWPEKNSLWRTDAGFLTGAVGIALALLAAVSAVPPDWDRILLLSFRNHKDIQARR